MLCGGLLSNILHRIAASDCNLLLTITVEILTALLLLSTCTSHIVHFTLKITTMALHAAEITAGTEINPKPINSVQHMHGSCMQLIIMHGHIITLACYL